MDEHKSAGGGSVKQACRGAGPPGYGEAVSTGAEFHSFVRHSRWSSKVYIRVNGVSRYCFAPAKKDPRLWIYAGSSTDNAQIGFLDFPSLHNAFRLNFHVDGASPDKFDFTDVKSRIGFPHPGSFSFKSAVSGVQREYEWKNRSQGKEAKPVVYELSVDGSQHVAILTVHKKNKEATGTQWIIQPETELEQALLVLSAVGVVFRLSHPGVYKENEIARGHARFAMMWYSALMGMAVMG